MRLSIGDVPETVRAISSTHRRKLPLQVIPSSVTFPSVMTDTRQRALPVEKVAGQRCKRF